MNQISFPDLFSGLSIPVVVCENSSDFPVVYMNVQAGILFSPSHSVDTLVGRAAHRSVDSLFDFGAPQAATAFRQMLTSTGRVEHYACEAITFEGKRVPVQLNGNIIGSGSATGHFVLYITGAAESSVDGERHGEEHLAAIINASFLAGNVAASIQTVLAMAGRYQRVSRAYIFEEISATATCNTYEWCADGVEPAIQDLQDLKKEDYNYDVIVESGMYITNDVRELPEGDREILEMQGIKSLAIITLYDYGKPLGYVGFDDTEHYRAWSQQEIQFLKSVSGVLATLIKRRNAEFAAQRSQNIMQLMLDVSDDIVYANTLDDYTVIFVSESLARALGKTRKELLGKKCWKVLQQGQTGPCPFCPIPKIAFTPGEDRSPVYTWEVENTCIHKTYIAKDSIVRWVDGQYVHVETAIDISTRKDYEQQLTYYASTDVMTGAYNRDWGARILEEKLRRENGRGTLAFIDLDGLKKVNDQFGHTVGDEMITETINTIRANMAEGELLCRWGGDEFLLWLNGDLTQAQKKLERMQQDADAFNQSTDKSFKISFSYGLVPFGGGAPTTLDALVTEADKEMYKHKMGKRGIPLNRRRDDPAGNR